MDITPEIQAHFDGVINKRYAELQAKADAKLREELAAVEVKHKEQLAAKEIELAELKKTSGNKGNEDVDVTALKAEVEKLKADNAKKAELARKAQLLTVASELNAVNGEQVTMLVSPYIKSEGEQLSVINAEGQTRLNGEGKAMTVREYMSEFLTGNPHLVKAGGQPGAGSQGAKGINSDNAKTIKRGDYEKLSPQAKSDFIKAGGRPVD